ncbi:MAG: CDP-glycerol glycerophosphotransferase family protein [Phascolarctobacterium sp.]|uniref:bifunctional glycosyltransferase/CDP-glycerol:glycerophosphate glycerophosphotransferase n=1 Tax=Phascolarctobacterium sp. TaxID=2049039 RepID=UPI0026DC89F2|nr:CDP-glycerol glycerophosphotransferase family protein [Phascolarctobacterium sp.]MDO4921680.1 CDP-glycerol glycerophosphotransferase family protein [Phascolarctobacterium sp.]
MYKFKISIVMAVYNVEQFLAAAIESVIKQDIGFQENVQLILVDDGSTDKSGKICDEFAVRFPDNIIVMHQENGGVSSARNEGLRHIEGKYVNFLDADDMLSEETLKNVFNFFEKHYEVVDVVSIPIMFFDGQSGNHILNYKFNQGSRIIDLEQEYDCVQLSLSSAFVKHDIAKEIYFDSRLQYAEDAKECLRILCAKKKLGVVKEAQYNYRKRSSGEQSALQKALLKKAWYMPSLNYFSYSSLNKAKELCGEAPLFVQYTLMYDLQWRFKVNIRVIRDTLSEEEAREFIKACFDILVNFEDKIILGQRHITPEVKSFLLAKKHNATPEIGADANGDLAVNINGTSVIALKQCALRLEFINIANGSMEIEGAMTVIPTETPTEICVSVNGKFLPCEINDARKICSECWGELISEAKAFKVKIDSIGACDICEIKFYEKVDNQLVEKESVRFGKFFPLTKSFKNSYALLGGYTLTYEDNALRVSKSSVIKSIAQEVKLLGEFCSKGQAAKKAIVSRCLYHAMKPFFKNEIWLFSDRINKADDNGEALFKYVNENNLPVNAYFVIRKDSADYAVVKKLGKVLDYHSWKHKLYHLLADKTVSSAADDFVYNPFYNNEKYYHDILYKQKRIFLQHGITKDNLSDWLNRYNKNLSLFVTSAVPEYESIVQGEYFYSDSVVKLTGMPRYDRLVDKKEKVVTIMPTWRSSLGSNATYFDDGIKRYDKTVMNSQYFKYYNEFINHPRLLQAAVEMGYVIQFMPHPNLIGYIDWFDRNNVKFCSISTNYRDIFAESSMIITDYSSVAFDFAYLRKPVIYTQFDKEQVFSGSHIYSKGYFDYERDGFGEVEYDLEKTVDRIIEYMENDCTLKDKYRERIERFFAFNDRNNCRRVWEAIKSIDV